MALLRELPSVSELAQRSGLAPWALAVSCARAVLDEVRTEVLAGSVQVLPDLNPRMAAQAALVSGARLRPVLNATGVVLHTNLGRSAWSVAAREAAVAAMGPCNVELELSSGRRGGRLSGVTALLSHLTGAEAALVVNNCAAAVLLCLTALAHSREVIVSRGELVEIGGSFRVPEVVASGGAQLVEVGSTNRTRVADYAAAITDRTALLLRVHPSNFRVVGFTETPPRQGLVALAHQRGLPMVEDLGAGSLEGALGEPAVAEVVAAGVDLVMFSGDKLLGGPQAGVIVGEAAWVARLRAHPLYRALRVGKVTLAALEGTLAAHARGVQPPTVLQLHADPAALRGRAEALAEALRASEVPCAVVPHEGRVGGGALPGQALPGWAVSVGGGDVRRVAQALRLGEPAVVARVHQGALLIDLRCVPPAQDLLLARRVATVILAR